MYQSILSILLYLTISLAIFGCSQNTANIKSDNTISGQSTQLREEGKKYSGPKYRIGIISFENETRARNLEKKSINILRTLLSEAGLVPVILSTNELQSQEKLSELQLSGIIKNDSKDYTEGFGEIDFRLSGSITAYTETEEATNILVAQSKSQISRITVDYALVDPVDGKTIIAKSGFGEYKKTTGGLLGLGTSSSADLGLREGALRDALSKATTEIMKKISAKPYQGIIVNVDSDSILFKAGELSNLPIGTTFKVYRLGKEIKDPTNGEILGRKRTLIGTISLESHMNDKLSSAKNKSIGTFKVGDVVIAE